MSFEQQIGTDADQLFSVHQRKYRSVKWFWLVAQCTMPILAAFEILRYLKAEPGSVFVMFGVDHGIFVALFHASLMVYLVLWLIAESILMMYRFPLEFPGALRLTGSFVLQFAVLTLTGGSPFYAAYTSIFVTLAVVYGSLAALALIEAARNTLALFRAPWKILKLWLLVLCALMAGGLPLLVLASPVWDVYRKLSGLYLLGNVTVLLLYVAFTFRQLKGASVFADPDPLDEAYMKEWQRWAGPTIILLILVATTSAIVVGHIASEQQ